MSKNHRHYVHLCTGGRRVCSSFMVLMGGGGGGGVNQGWVCNKNRRVTNEFDVDRRLKARTLFFSYEIAN